MNQSRSQALRASNTKKKVNLGKGRFASILDQRKTNLEQQREKLELAKMKLREDQMQLDEEMKKLQGQQDLIQEIEKDIQNLNSTTLLSEDINCSAIRHQMTVLQKTEADLTQQLKIAQQQLDEKTYKLKVSNSRNVSPEKISLLEKEINEKAIQFRMIRELLETLKTEILTRENDVILLEFNALEHKKDLDKASKERENLIRRKKDAEITKLNIIHDIKKNDQIRIEYSEKRKDLETKLSSAQSEKERLDEIEKNLNEKENQLKQKQEEFQQMQNELNQTRIKKAQEDISKQADIDNQKMAGAFDTTQNIDDQAEENVNIEIELDTEEKQIRIRTNNYETKQATQNQLFNEKKQKIIDMINSLQQDIDKAEKKEEVESEVNKLKEENNKVKEDIDNIDAEIAKIKSQIFSEAEMKKIISDQQNEMKKLSKEESEIRTAIIDLNSEERELQEDDEDIKQKTSSLEKDRYFYEKNRLAIDQEINIIKTKVEDAKKRCQIAYNNYMKNQKKK